MIIDERRGGRTQRKIRIQGVYRLGAIVDEKQVCLVCDTLRATAPSACWNKGPGNKTMSTRAHPHTHILAAYTFSLFSRGLFYYDLYCFVVGLLSSFGITPDRKDSCHLLLEMALKIVKRSAQNDASFGMCTLSCFKPNDEVATCH